MLRTGAQACATKSNRHLFCSGNDIHISGTGNGDLHEGGARFDTYVYNVGGKFLMQQCAP